MPRRRPAEQCLELMRTLAFVMQADPRGRQVAISPHAAAVALQASLGGESEEARYRAAEEFLRDEETNTGILIAREGLLRFWHLTFQEYLAAHVLAVRTRERHRLLFDERRLYLPDWRRTVLLLGGILRALDKQLIDDFLAAILETAAAPGSTLLCRAQSAGLIAAVLGDLSASGYRFEESRWPSLLQSLEEIFTVEAVPIIDFQTRLAAAYAVEDHLGLYRGIEMARSAQAKLTSTPPLRSRTLDCSARCTRIVEIGGDYYDFLRLDADRTGIVIADVSGKGVDAALSMLEVQAHLRSMAGPALLDIASSVSLLNRQVWRALPERFYFTLFFGVYDERTRHLRYANCGHVPPLCLRRDGRVEMLESTSTVLGMWETVELTTEEIQLEPGDILLVVTDGITEAMNPESEEFGQSRLIEAVKRAADLPAEAILTAVLKQVDQFSGGQQFDDLTLMVARVM
jgi:serine phosphatase RsbU (regulator of sigma subunit)